ncbi:MAG: efflux RND transporter periplasmic adaptor subunit [Sphingobacterium sp.]|uniref:efflux RND transporter periplasmic adaptor subunit n=1 Tax=Sphingobacterium sp. JB170 TaxID=1434842 RepID=UPI00097F430B|nr:efflux RND transporter periplasmic adaptor subunit [Sphingobacterium sp. JB170]SJN29855.1 Probable Co/Zn/Cd efflux system membrane fusion protein [Sphingobacterium sp. JB170]
MKHHKYIVLFYSLVLSIAISLWACTSNQKEEQAHSHDTHAGHSSGEKGAANTVLLTAAQVKNVGIELGTIEQKELSTPLKANGFLIVPNNNKATATTLFGGTIKTLNAQIGDYVKKGQIIAKISNPQFLVLQEEYISVNSRIEFAELELKRQTELYEGNVGAKKNLQSAQTDWSTLSTRKASLAQQIQMMGIQPSTLSNTNLQTSISIKSPINGTVSNVFAKIGSYVGVSSPIIELVENSALHLDLHVFEKDLQLIKVGQKIDFIVTNSPNKSYTAEVYKIGSSFDSDSKTIAVHSNVIGDKTGLIDGMNITGTVNISGELSPAVPSDAIVHADGKYYIFLLKEESAAAQNHQGGANEHKHQDGVPFERVEVAIGTTLLGYTAIAPVEGIKEGSQIVVSGAFFVNAKLSNTGQGHSH